jgi:hypothetical protein
MTTLATPACLASAPRQAARPLRATSAAAAPARAARALTVRASADDRVQVRRAKLYQQCTPACGETAPMALGALQRCAGSDLFSRNPVPFPIHADATLKARRKLPMAALLARKGRVWSAGCPPNVDCETLSAEAPPPLKAWGVRWWAICAS